MRAGQDVLSDLRAALGMEWVLPHGTGGSSSGTACGANARRAHALLTAAGPHGRLTTLLLKFDERLRTAGASFELGCGVLPGGNARPAGHLLLESFDLDPWPRWIWRAGGVAIEKALLPVSGHDAVAIRYRLIEGATATLSVSPLVVARDPDAVQRESESLHVAPQGVPGRILLQLSPDRPPLTLWHNGAFLPARVWQHGLLHPLETGEEEGEDAFVPGHIEASLAPGGEFHVVAAAEPDLFRALAREDRLGTPPPRTLAECVRIIESRERERHAERERAAVAAAATTAAQAAEARESGAAPAGNGAAQAGNGSAAEAAIAERRGTADTRDSAARLEARAAERAAPEVAEPAAAEGDRWTPLLSGIVLSGLTRGARGLTIAPTLPTARQRVAEILRAVPALLSLRAFDAAREILVGLSEHLDDGVAPEEFDADGTPRYGDAAPALWLVHAAEHYVRRSGDVEIVRHLLYSPLESVIQAYRAGTRYGIRAGADSLLAAGDAGIKRADLNALWYHALVAMAQLAKKTERKEAAAFYLAWARDHQTRFNEAFWDEKRGMLYDAIEERGPVRRVAPGQLLAARLAPAILAPERVASLVEALGRALYTLFGLRESPRDLRAHTQWLGLYHSAYLRAHGRSAAAQAQVRDALKPLRARIESGAGGSLPEWYEAPLPAPRATRAKADAEPEVAPGAEEVAAPAAAGGDPISVLAAAELLPVWIEELDHTPSATPILTS
jgi:4-alpha-glucanotransferase